MNKRIAIFMNNLLLPFTHGISEPAITCALAFAQHYHFTLVALSLIRLPDQPGKHNPRLEDIQQSKDFLEFVYHKATRQGVPIVRVELYTHHPVRSIRTLAQEMECAGVLLFVRSGTGVLLATSEVKQLLEEESIPLYIARLPSRERRFPHPEWLTRWLKR